MENQASKVTPPTIQIGRVETVEPLTVMVGDLLLDRENLLVSESLLSGHARKADLGTIDSVGRTGVAGGHSHSSGSLKIDDLEVSGETDSVNNHSHTLGSINIGEKELIFKSSIKNGDRLAVLATADRQTYIVLAKVVKP